MIRCKDCGQLYDTVRIELSNGNLRVVKITSDERSVLLVSNVREVLETASFIMCSHCSRTFKVALGPLQEAPSSIPHATYSRALYRKKGGLGNNILY